ncbi:EexN family lipoprotein [Cedecea sp.]|jgi:hypothetical protein|uniref:EexN family lipoprotein n=1 Tax=Cedecea sp. TaxID=1970739 RepID=UPI002F3FDCCD
MKKLTFVTPLVLSLIFLSGCDEKYSREWFIKHHDEMIAKYTECLLDGTWDIKECQNARDAMKHEQDKPDVIEGKKQAIEKLKDKISLQPVPDLNNVR